MQISNAQIVSQEQTVNGFSNFFLGVNSLAEPYIALNPRDPLNVVCAFNNTGYVTNDGANWSRIYSFNSGDPFIAFDSLGNAYYTPGINWNQSSLSLRKSTDKGFTWNSYLIYSGNNDKPCIVGNKAGGIYSNYIYSAWQQFTPSLGLFFARSTNQGENWSFINMNIPQTVYAPYLAIGPSNSTPGGIIYYGYNYVVSVTTENIKIKKSTDAGISFSPEIIASTFTTVYPLRIKDNLIAVGSIIQMTADNSYGAYRGNVYIVYTGRGASGDKADVFFLRSTNYGDNWSQPIKLNDDNTLNDQWMPAVTTDKNGNIFVVWYDSRIDPLNYLTLLYGTVSTNGGNSFFPDFPVSTTSFNPALMAQNGFMGDYISVSASGNTAIAAWIDGRNNNFGNYVGYFPDFSLTAAPASVNMGSNDSTNIVLKVPGIKGPFSSGIKFTAVLDSLPSTGNIYFNFEGRDSINAIPDSLILKIRTVGVTNSHSYRIFVTAQGMNNGIPVHVRTINISVNPIGINNISSQVPKEFKLYQNYPNPFNPMTKVKFQMPNKAFVKLIVYDVLGREAATLVNEQLNAGTYEINWDASNYPSGMYFYKLVVRQAGSSTGDGSTGSSREYVETKKMVLIK